MKRVVIVGASGFIGSHLVTKFQKSGCEITTYSSRKNSWEGVSQVQIDWNEPLFENFPAADCVIYSATQVNDNLIRKNPKKSISQNLGVIEELTQTIKLLNLKPHIIHLSTVSLYNSNHDIQVNESSPISENSHYEILKKRQEDLFLEKVSNFSGLSILRLSNIFGRETLDEGSGRGFLEISINKMLNGELTMCYGHGKYLRDYLTINDLVDAIWKIANSSLNLRVETLNVASGESIYLIDALQIAALEVSKITSLKPIIKFTNPPDNISETETRNFKVDVRKLASTIEWNPQRNFQDFISSYVGKLVSKS